MRFAPTLLLAAVACTQNIATDDVPTDTDPVLPAFCAEGPSYVYDPNPATFFTTFPDDVWTVLDETTRTGRRLAVGTSEYPGAAFFPDNLVENFDHASTLDGFGRTTPVVFQFDADVSGLISPSDVVLLANDVPMPFTLSFEDDGHSLFVEPLTALPAGASIVAAVFRNEQGCLVPSPALQARLTTDDDALSQRMRQGLTATGRSIDDVGALVVYTTHTSDQVAVDVAAWIEARDYALDEPAACGFSFGLTLCDAELTVDDLRDTDGVIPPGPPASRGTYDLPLRMWLPIDDDGPWPVVVCGHGLTGNKSQCDTLGRQATARGVAVIAPDAIEHGEHPSKTDTGIEALNGVSIFGIRAIPPGIHGLKLRDNFHQAAFDKLMLVRAIEQGMDVDGDGTVDLDASRMAYLGASLGGIMGVEPAALTDAFESVILIVAGGHLTRIISDGEAFSLATDLLTPRDWTDGDLARAFPLLQMLMDGADPAVFGPHLAADRLLDDHAPHVLLMLAEDDEVVPNSANDALARALGLPGLGEEIWPIDGIGFSATSLSGNLPSGATGAVVQLSEVTVSGRVEQAEHGNLHVSEEAEVLVGAMLEALKTGAVPVLVGL